MLINPILNVNYYKSFPFISKYQTFLVRASTTYAVLSGFDVWSTTLFTLFYSFTFVFQASFTLCPWLGF